MNTKLTGKLDRKLRVKSLACWFLMAATCPQVLAFNPAASQAQVPANKSEAIAVASRITDINSSVTGDRFNLTLSFASSDRPQVTYARQGKDWIAVLNGAQLQLGSGNASYTKSNPAPGITAIEAIPYETNKVRIRVTAASPEVLKDLIKRQDTSNSLVFSLEMQTNSISSANAPDAGVLKSDNDSNKVLTAQSTAANPSSVGQPLFQPKVTITNPDGTTRVAQSSTPNSTPPSATKPVTPQLQGRVPGIAPSFRPIKTPPVGDIATTTSKLRADIVDLGSAERVPRITLRNAPAIEVLTLIGRVAGLSVVSAGAGATPAAGAAPAAGATSATSVNQPVSLSIENETAQDVFNNVLRITGLEANRIGNTIFVATKLPVTLKNLVTKTYRLNQITTGEASAYLIGLGASRVVTRQRPIPGVQTATIGTAAQTIVNITTEAVPTLETVSITSESGATPLLRGLQVIAEERSNSVTLIGTPRQVEYAEAQIARLDLRKRQVMVNVRVVELTVNNGQTLTGFLTSSGGNPTITQGIDFNASPPNSNGIAITFDSTQPLSLPSSIFASLQSSIANGNAKVITDPNLTVQEGETATIALTDQVVNNVTTTVTPPTPPATLSTTTTTATFAQVGLTLSINIEKIDDNGFINLSVSPRISTPLATTLVGLNLITPISERVLNSGRIRLRDAQTLVLSGVIRDSDSETLNKVPLLGDLPIIGALFRSTSSVNRRSEVIIIVTPRIIDDSQNATWGYTYQPGAETQKVLDSNQIKAQ
ncbi:MAG: secretin and TonB N-terminal domain-containing protein [Pseudanabaena sp. ELA645]|jgi:type IV pilus assembly protein PilQ